MTSFATIYNRSLFKMKNYGILKLEVQKREALLREHLMSAQIDFQHVCKVDLTDYDETEKQYKNKLNDEEIDILATGIAFHWVNSETLSSENFRNVLLPKDYATYSPANLLKHMQELRSTLRDEFFGKINKYSFRKSNLSEV